MPQDTPRHNRPSTISKRLQADDDDGPTYVDAETNEVVTQDDYQNMMGVSSKPKGGESRKAMDTHGEQADMVDSGKSQVDESNVGHTENVAGLGERKKRRAGKMIGNDEGVPQTELRSEVDQSSLGTQKKRKKKIKLSFADEANNEGE